MTALDIIDQVPEFAGLVATELRRIMSPHEDSISTNEAYRRYGRAWVEKYTKFNELHPQIHGNKKTYSVAELERCKAKENAIAKIVFKK